jgi:1-aminocyclopropane-1-carboxylate deaminase
MRELLTLPNGQIRIQRDDLLHPIISGNKWRKLRGWLQRAEDTGARALLTYGGAYSNHVLATACAAHSVGIPSWSILRGEEMVDNDYLRAAADWGMKFIRVSRTMYRDKAAALTYALSHTAELNLLAPSLLVIPEGGCGPAGFLGFHELTQQWLAEPSAPQYIAHASATGTTAVGLALAIQAAGLATKVLAIPVLKNLAEQQALAQQHHVHIHWLPGYEGAGYAKVSPELRQFTAALQLSSGIPLEPVYTGKALYGLNAWLAEHPTEAAGLVFLHTGGLGPHG